MQRRKFLRASLAVAVGSNLSFSFNATAEMLLKFGDSDTPIFPFRGGQHGWWGYVDQGGYVVISPDDSHIDDRSSDFYAGLGAVHFYPKCDGWNYVLRCGLLPNRHHDSGNGVMWIGEDGG